MDYFVRFFESLLGPANWKLLVLFAAAVLGLAALWVISVLLGINPLGLMTKTAP